MNEIVNMFLLEGDKLMPEMHFRQPGFTGRGGLFTKKKTKTEYKKKQEIHDIFIKTNLIKLVFNMAWLMEILKIYLEEHLLIKYSVIKHLILLKIRNMMDININVDLLKWFIKFLIEKLLLRLHRQRLSYASYNQLQNIWD